MDGWMERRMIGCKEARWTSRWMDEWMDGRVNDGMEGSQMDG
jgi:hypothetical protein